MQNQTQVHRLDVIGFADVCFSVRLMPQCQYYVYVMEANLSFQNGMVIPLLSEFLKFEKGDINHNPRKISPLKGPTFGEPVARGLIFLG